MSDSVRIDYVVKPQGEPEVKRLTEAIAALQQKVKQSEAQSLEFSQGMRATGDALSKLLDKLSTAKLPLNGAGVAIQKELETAQAAFADLAQRINAQHIKVQVDDSQLTGGGRRLQQFERDLEAAQVRAATKRRSPELENAQLAAQQLREAAGKDIGTGPAVDAIRQQRLRDAEAAEREAEKLRAASSGDVLGGPLRKLETAGLDRKIQELHEQIALETGGAEAVLNLRIKELEVIRQRGLLEAKSVEAQQRVNQSIDSEISKEREFVALERKHAGNVDSAKASIAAEKELEQAKVHVAALVDSTNEKELTGAKKVNAERERFLKDYGKTEELRGQINTTFDKKVTQERSGILGRTLGGRAGIRDATLALYAPEFAAADAAARVATSFGPVGIGAGIATVAVGALGKAFVGLVESEAAAAEQEENTGIRLGLTGAQVHNLSVYAKEVGVDFAALEGAGRQLGEALEDPAGAGKRAAAALGELGIQTLKAKGGARELGPVVIDVLKELAKVEDTTKRIELAYRLLPRGGAKTILPFIEDPNRLKEVLNAIPNEEAQRKLLETDKAFDKLHTSWGELKRDFAVALTPVVKFGAQEANSFLQGLRNIGETAGRINRFANGEPEPAARKIFGPAQVPEALDNSQSIAFLKKRRADTEGLEADVAALKTARAEALAHIQQNAKLKQVDRTTEAADIASVTTADADIKAKDAEIKRLRKLENATGSGHDAFGDELERIAAEARKFKFPASEYGRITDLQNELVAKLRNYNKEVLAGTLTRAEANELGRQEKEQTRQSIVLEAQRLGEERRQRRVEIQNIGVEAGLDKQQREFQSAEQLARINSRVPEGDRSLVEQAFEHQKQIAQSTLETRLKQNDEILPKARPATDEDRFKKERADATDRAAFEKQLADAEVARKVASAEIDRREFESAKRDAEELAHIREETELHGYQLQIEHAAHLADLNRDQESPVASLERAFETEKKLAQLAFDFETRQNALTFKDDPAKRAIEDEHARQRLIEDGQRSEYEREERLAALRKQERDEAKAAAASLYDAIRGGPRGLRDFFKQQADRIGQNLFAQAVGPVLGRIGKDIDPTGQGILHNVLRGTVLGTSEGATGKAEPEPILAVAGGLEQHQRSAFKKFLLGSDRPTLPLITPPEEVRESATPQQILAQGNAVSTEEITKSIAELGKQPIPGVGEGQHTEELVTSLDLLRPSIDALREAIESATPGGAIGGPAVPGGGTGPGRLFVGNEGTQTKPVLDELSAASLVHSTTTTQKTVQRLANLQRPHEAPLGNQFSDALGEYADVLNRPVALAGSTEDTNLGSVIAPLPVPPPFREVVRHVGHGPVAVTVPAAAINHFAPRINVSGPAVPSIYVQPGVSAAPIVNVPITQALNDYGDALTPEVRNAIAPLPSDPEFRGQTIAGISPRGFPVAGEVAATDESIAADLLARTRARITADAFEKIPHELRGYTPEEIAQPGGSINPRTGHQYTVGEQLARVPILDTPTAGVQGIAAGTAQLAQPELAEKLRGTGKIALGTVELGAPAIGLAAGSPLAAAGYTALSSITQRGAEAGGKAAGLNPEDAEMLAALAGLAPFGFGKVKVAGLGEHPFVKGLLDETGSVGVGSGRTQRLFHGTDVEPFDAFRQDRIGSSTDEGLLGAGHYFSTDPNIGRGKKTLLAADVAVEKPLELAFPDWRASKTTLVNEALGTSALRGPELTKELTSRGYDGVTLDYSPVGYKHKEVMAVDAGQTSNVAEVVHGSGPLGALKDDTGSVNIGAPNPAIAAITALPSAPAYVSALDQNRTAIEALTATLQSASEGGAGIGPGGTGGGISDLSAVDSTPLTSAPTSDISPALEPLPSAPPYPGATAHQAASRPQAAPIPHRGDLTRLGANISRFEGFHPAIGEAGSILGNIEGLRAALAGRKARNFEEAYHRLPVGGEPPLTLPNLELPQQAGLSPSGFPTLGKELASIGDIANQGGILSDTSRPDSSTLAPGLYDLPQAPAFSPELGPSEGAPVSVSPEGIPTFTATGTYKPPQEISAVPADLDQQISGSIAPSAQPLPEAVLGVGREAQGFNTRGAEILPQSVLNAADPFNSVMSSLETLNNVFSSVSSGFGAGGLGGGTNSSSSLLSTPISRLFGLGNIQKDKGGSLSQAGDIFATGATVTAGILGAVSGFKHGGARGDLSGTASILGTAAILDPEPISKAILGIGAGIAAGISALLPDPRAQRQRQLTREIFEAKRAGFEYNQPGIDVEESATGRAVSTDYLGNLRVLNGRPQVSTINEAVGFDPLHADRVVTQSVRQVGVGPLGGLPTNTNPGFNAPVMPLGSSDLTPIVNRFGPTTSGSFGSSIQRDSAHQDGPAQQPPPFAVTFNNNFVNHNMDAQDIMRRGPDIASALEQQLQGTHRIASTLRGIITQT